MWEETRAHGENPRHFLHTPESVARIEPTNSEVKGAHDLKTTLVYIQLFQLRLSTSKAEKSNTSAKGCWEPL
jgi:hypothetical protein